MSFKKIIPCLDMKDGKVVKGINFEGLREVGNPPDMAAAYEKQGADELTFLDISATVEGRDTLLENVRQTASRITVPLCVGGGIKSVDEMQAVLDAGASKASMNSAAVAHPEVVTECSDMFGKGRVVVAVDVKKTGDHWEVVTHGGTKLTGLDAVEWSQKVEDLGAGEILLTSMDADGVKTGYDIPLTAAVSDAVKIPVTASGGCGSIEDIYQVFAQTNAASALAASVFHFNEFTVGEVKQYLKDRGVNVR